MPPSPYEGKNKTAVWKPSLPNSCTPLAGISYILVLLLFFHNIIMQQQLLLSYLQRFPSPEDYQDAAGRLEL